MFWYGHNTLILPEAFIWHVFRCVASALAFCNHGTNSGRRIQGWETIIHADLKEDNIFLCTPDEKENRVYPFVKLADLGMAITEPIAKYKKKWEGTRGYFPPEAYARTNRVGRWQSLESTEPSPESDIWTLGLTIRRLISLINKFVPEHSARELIRRGHKRPFYSPALNRLVEACMQEYPSKRPKAHHVYEVASHFHEIHRRKLYKRVEYSRQQNLPVYLGQVLFSDAHKTRFENDANFRTQYEEANCGPLRDWLGITKEAWRNLDPDHGFTGPRESDLLISPPALHHEDPQQNTRAVLEDDRYKRWYAEYFEAAGAGLPPPQKPESLPTPDSATTRVLHANWTNVPKARQQSISEGSSWFGHWQMLAADWTTDDYKRGEVFIPRPGANPNASLGGDDHRGDDDDDDDDDDDSDDNHSDSARNEANLNSASRVGDENTMAGRGAESEPESNRNRDARIGAAHNNEATGEAQHKEGRPVQHEQDVHPPQIRGPSQPPQYGRPIYQDQQGGVLHHPPHPSQHGPYQGTSLHGGPVPFNTHQAPTNTTVLPGGPSQPSYTPQPQHQDPTTPNPDDQPSQTHSLNTRQEKRARFASNVATQVAKGVQVFSKLDGRDGSQWRRERGLQGSSGQRRRSKGRSRGRSKRKASQKTEKASRGDEAGQEEQEAATKEDEGRQKEKEEGDKTSQGQIEMKW